MEIQDVILIGTGRLSQFYARHLPGLGLPIHQVYGRDPVKAGYVASLCGADAVTQWQSLRKGASLYLVLVSDQSIPEVAGNLMLRDELLVHAAGSLPADIFSGLTDHYGVCWPLQTFSEGHYPDPADIPFIIEASNPLAERKLKAFASCLSPMVQTASFQERQIMHLAAVFVSNFSNHLYAMAEELLATHRLPAHLLAPIIRHTAARVGSQPARQMQTGPAVRFDHAVLESQLSLLSSHPEWAEVYRLLTQSIQDFANHPEPHEEL